MTAPDPVLLDLDARTDLDPVDWEAFRAIAHASLDAAIDHVRGVRDRPVWQPVSPSFDAFLDVDPTQGAGLAGAEAELRETIAREQNGNVHPSFFGWVHGGGTAEGILAAMWQATLNPNVGGREHGAVHVERRVMAWCREAMGFPDTATGLLVSGTSTATLIALASARERARREHPDDERPLLVYVSEAAHGCIVKAAAVLGLPTDAVRRVPVDDADRMSVPALAEQIQRDRAAGERPAIIVATAGTVTVGAIDDLGAVADLRDRESMWMHVDGAFGALGRLGRRLRGPLGPIDRADSVAFDFHKWMQVPFAAGCALVRDAEAHHAAFSPGGTYPSTTRGLGAGRPWYAEYGIELTRPFRALPVWMTIRTHGFDRIGAMIDARCALATQMAERFAAHPSIEVICPPETHITCFRHLPPGIDPDSSEADRHQESCVVAIQERGLAVPSTARRRGRIVIRAGIANHRTTLADVERFVDDFTTIADEVAAAR